MSRETCEQEAAALVLRKEDTGNRLGEQQVACRALTAPGWTGPLWNSNMGTSPAHLPSAEFPLTGTSSTLLCDEVSCESAPLQKNNSE